ncbi:MAG: fluoride efflux transporter FluC [Acidimicrobiales bacterium]|jgi:CrcB protein
MTVLAFVVVAALFTLVRALSTAGQPVGKIPWRTFAVNVSGAFLLGLVVTSTWWDNPVVASTAALGSVTTFSTVAAEAASLLDNGRKGRAMAYVGMTVVAGVAAAWFGLSIGDLS